MYQTSLLSPLRAARVSSVIDKALFPPRRPATTTRNRAGLRKMEVCNGVNVEMPRGNQVVGARGSRSTGGTTARGRVASRRAIRRLICASIGILFLRLFQHL